MPEHGDARNHREETTYGESQKLVDVRTGAVVYEGPMSSSTSTVYEKYCAVCGDWFEVRGIFGVFGWDDAHAHADVLTASSTM